MAVDIYFAGYRNRKRIVRNTIEWFLPKYVGGHILSICVHDKRMNREGTHAACSVVGRCCRPREFMIEMNNSLEEKEYISSLIHELIHIKQWIFQQRITRENLKNFWYGEHIDDDVEYMAVSYTHLTLPTSDQV